MAIAQYKPDCVKHNTITSQRCEHYSEESDNLKWIEWYIKTKIESMVIPFHILMNLSPSLIRKIGAVIKLDSAFKTKRNYYRNVLGMFTQKIGEKFDYHGQRTVINISKRRKDKKTGKFISKRTRRKKK